MQLVPIHILSGWPEHRTPDSNLHWLASLAGVNKIVNWLPVQYNILEYFTSQQSEQGDRLHKLWQTAKHTRRVWTSENA